MIDLAFEKLNGLVPAALQDAESGAVLMVGFMNREAMEKTLQTGLVTFFSRTRNRLWTKGETSGNFAQVISAMVDCDRDAVLLKVRVRGKGQICHQGTVTCFTERIELPTSATQKAEP